jgi:hypothetical protein
MEKLIKLIKELNSKSFWGTLEIKFENGVVVHIKKLENIKP